MARLPEPMTNITIDRLHRLRPGERFRYYSGNWKQDLDRSREEGGSGLYVEVMEAIGLTVRNLVRQGRIRVEEVERRIERGGVRVTDYIAIGR